ncbi:MAG TPA: hypothetical protein PK765_01560 [bacterium]|nr:hypothetical protein [bacterium]
MDLRVLLLAGVGTATAILTSAVTMSGGVMQFAPSDETMLSDAMGNTLASLTAFLGYILPYLGVAVIAGLFLTTVYGLVTTRLTR